METENRLFSRQVEMLHQQAGMVALASATAALLVTAALAHAAPPAWLMFGLDRFKNINDSLGHAAGDSLICAVAERLKQNLRTEDFIARPGSDEFLVVLPYVKDSQDLARAAMKLQRCFEMPFVIAQQEMYLTPSIGIGTFPDDGDTPEQLILRAETAMHQAKKAGGNGFAFYAAEMSALARENMNLENQLRHAIENGEFFLHYQPQLDLQTNAIVGVEALLRWNHPGLGMVAPLRFIPVAEMSGLIVPIGEWVMLEACRQAQDWQKRGAPQPDSRSRRDDLDRRFWHRLFLAGLPAAIPDRYPENRPFLRARRPPRHAQRRHVTAILAMARQLQIGVVAEGIETAAQQSFLAKHGCGIGQGYYFSKPLPPEDCEKLFARRPARAMAFSVVK